MASNNPFEAVDPVLRLESDLLRYSPFRGWQIVVVTFPNTVNSDAVVQHNLTVDTPESISYSVLQTNCPQAIYHAPTSTWTHHTIRLRSNVAGGQAIILLTTSKSNNPKLSLFDLDSIIQAPTLPTPSVEGEMLVARRTTTQNSLKYWHDGGTLIQLHQVRATTGALKYWSDGGAFEGLTGASGTLVWTALTPGPDKAVLTMHAGIPVWSLPTGVEEAPPPPTPTQPAPAPEVPPPAPRQANARASAANDRLVYSASTAIRFPIVTIDTDGMRSWTNTPPSGVTAGAFKIPINATYTITISVNVSDPDDDGSMTLAVVLKRTDANGNQVDLATSNTINVEDGGSCTINTTVYLEEGMYIEAHRSGSLAGNTSVVNTTSYMDVRGVA